MIKKANWELWTISVVTVMLLALAVYLSWGIYESVSVSIDLGLSQRLATTLVMVQFLMGILLGAILITAHRKKIQAWQLSESLKEIESLKTFNENIVANIPSSILVLDHDLRVLSANAAFFQNFPTNTEHAMGKVFCEVFHCSHLSQETSECKSSCELCLLLTQVLLEGYPNLNHVMEVEVERKGKRWFEISAVPLLSTSDRLLIIFEDITQRQRLQEELKQRREYVESLFRDVPDAIITIDSKSQVTEWNPGASRLFGYSRDETIGRDFDELISGKDRYFESSSISKIVLAGEPVTPREVTRYRKNGAAVQVIMSASPIHSNNGVVGAVGVYSDITALKRAQQKLESDNTKLRQVEISLRDSEERFGNLAEQSPNMIFIHKGGKVIYANQKCEEVMEYSKNEFYAPEFSFFTLIVPEDHEKIMKNHQSHLQGMDVLPVEYSLITKHGKRLEALLTTKVIQYEGENAILGTVADITERKLAEKALLKSEERYRVLVEKAAVAILCEDSDGNLLYYNEKYAELFGYSIEEMKERPIRTLIHPDDYDRVMRYRYARIEGDYSPSRCQYRGIRKDGSTVFHEIDVVVIKDGDRVRGTISYIWDMTEYKQMECCLGAQDEQFRHMQKY
jgi:PAS domain S-box-containing protein